MCGTYTRIAAFSCHLSLETEIEKVNKSDGVVDCVNFEVGLVGPHSRNFSTLRLDDVLFVESSKIVGECKEEEQESCVFDFALEKQHKNTPHFNTKWFTMHHPLLGSLILIPPPYERSKNIDMQFGVKFISSRWRKKLMWVMPQH